MIDFTSALYLGMTHPSDSLRPWTSLSTGVPAALREAPDVEPIAARVAALAGSARATLLPSTLHLFFDLFVAIAPRGATIFVDAGAYPIARWGVERAAARGADVEVLPHFDPGALAHALVRCRRPALLVADGFCVGCGRPAPIGAWRDLVGAFDGALVLDDTQALGVLGAAPDERAPYGHRGGGTVRHLAAESANVVWAASLGKGMGVPVAALAGSEEMIERFLDRSETRVHSSPPSTAALRAAERALAINDADGERRRRRLLGLVRRFRRGLAERGLRARGGLFPVQTLALAPRVDARRVYLRLREQGVRTVLRRGRCGARSAELTFLLNASHRQEEIDRALEFVSRAVGHSEQPRGEA